MPTVRIEHGIHNFDTWKAAFDRDPAGRKRSGVQRYQILRPVDDPDYIMIDLDFGTTAEAESFLEVMHTVWSSSQAAPALAGKPQTRIVERVETVDL